MHIGLSSMRSTRCLTVKRVLAEGEHLAPLVSGLTGMRDTRPFCHSFAALLLLYPSSLEFEHAPRMQEPMFFFSVMDSLKSTSRKL
jgi:hypothetical protein